MHGLMMDTPLLISSIVENADINFHNREIVSVTADESLHRYTYKDCFRRVRKLANALEKLGLSHGDRVATMAWNDYRHLEAYYAIGGAGYVCHTINPRLFPEQIVFMINHAEDKWLMIDPLFIPLIEKIASEIQNVKGFIVMGDEDTIKNTTLNNVISYESFIKEESDEYKWPLLDERSAMGLCYTSGTTGDPKGVLYNHRATILHAYALIAPDAMNLSNRDCVLPVVPLFHVNSWGSPYGAMMVGSKIVYPGPKMADGETLYNLMEEEKVTVSLGVPTVWMVLLQYAAKHNKKLNSLQRTIIGGAAVPESMIRDFQDNHDVFVQQAWGMTEMTPLGTVMSLKHGMENLTNDELVSLQTKQGRGMFGVEMRIVDDNQEVLPWDGIAYGALQVKGPWICSDYYKLDGSAQAHTDDGWFDTGDVAKIDPEGYMQITDRTKDVIKSGGEWISSIEIENTAMGHPAIAEAAVIGVAHEKWTERPLLVAVKVKDQKISKKEVLSFLDGKIAKWWMPDDVIFIEEIPHTATGKIKKTALREQFVDYKLPS
ncbi:MAG: long-chain-fatty-acid--CoA ligase [Woeseiaceae bacterium]|jgi:acyl-CoA synthetase (AMP-forming)/AMP-acid ligase II|nr:long-chain-fatty-acid--CoA ligase [Woeseiaceae bacterium]|tara:strand:+ start:15896 stop:17527 length:1632 start_codon:yes stop_codon:yes gene_type:complete